MKKQVNSKRKDAGFSLIEILVVLGIVLVLASLAIPSLIKARQAANSTSAVQSLRTISTAELEYQNQCFGSYSTTLDASEMGPTGTAAACTYTAGSFTPPVAANFIADTNILSSGGTPGVKNGYQIKYVAGGAASGLIPTFTVTATPIADVGGTIAPTDTTYFLNETGIIRWAQGAAATATSPNL